MRVRIRRVEVRELDAPHAPCASAAMSEAVREPEDFGDFTGSICVHQDGTAFVSASLPIGATGADRQRFLLHLIDYHVRHLAHD